MTTKNERHMSNSDRIAAAIRTELKAAKISSRAVNVRVERYSMGSTVHVVVRSASVDFAAVKAIAESRESIRRDESGEILGGGNVYIDVRAELKETPAAPAPEPKAASAPEETLGGKIYVDKARPQDRANYAAALLAEADTTDNDGVRDANRENAVLCYLVAAEDCARMLGYAPDTLRAIKAAWELMIRDGHSL
jgi:hypothetical protein